MYIAISFAYGVFCYVVFFGTFLYTVGFLGNTLVPKSIDSGLAGSTGPAVLINTLLLGLFALQHSVMARPSFKAQWTKIIPLPIERSTYVLFSSLALILLYWQWRPMTSVVWKLDSATGQYIMQGLFFCGFLLVLYATFLIDHFDLFGLRQVWLHLRGVEYTHRPFGTPSLYRLIRHPLYLGWLLTFWCTPIMTQGHLFFAIVTTVYIFAAVVLEERDLVQLFGGQYQRYREQVPMILPWPRKRQAQAAPQASSTVEE